MSETRSIQRPRAAILGFAVVVLLAVLAYMLWPAATPQPGSSNQPREQQPATTAAGNTQGPLGVRLGELKDPPPEPAGDGRNPFRFYVKPPPPPAPRPRVAQPGEQGYVAPPPPPPPGPPPPPPPGKPDLTIAFSMTLPNTFVVTNSGTAPAGPFTVTAVGFPPAIQISGLAAGESATRTYANGCAAGKHEVRADSLFQVDESDETNNVISTDVFC